ncbi:MAG: hypothetical protein ABI647_19405 [Gemmatimonadota bacterium]
MTDGRKDPLSSLGVVAIVATIAQVILSSKLGIAYAIPTTIVGCVMLAIALKGPLGRAIAMRLEGKTAGESLPPEQVFGEIDELKNRVAELEERVDFSERLIASRKHDAPMDPDRS